MTEVGDRLDETVLICAPAGRDAALTAAALRGTANTRIFSDVVSLCEALADAGAAIIASEAFDHRALDRLRETLAAQPAWSDLPIIVFTTNRATAAENRRMLEVLASLDGNVTALERPVHALTMANAVRAALRARRRQYVTRDLLEDAENAVRQRDAFLAMLGHELRNPLGAIGNAVTLVSRSAPRETGLEPQLRLIERQVRVLTRLVNDLLDVSRVTSGKVSLQRETVDVVALVDRLVAQLQPIAREQQLHLSLSADPGPACVLGDAVRLEQVFTNLLGNALKYTPSRGRIEVAIRRDGSRVAIEVADSGVGIPAEALPHIFDLFAQVDTTIDRAQGGMGIGLTLVQSLVHLHGGSVAASSDGPGAGSRFTVTLPLTEAPEAHRDPGSSPTLPAAIGRHVLLVEDNPDNRASLRELLEFCGYRVDTASTGREGVARALELLPEVALVDIGLPELDGYAVAGRLRAELGDGIQLIAITGYGQREDVHRALESGFDAHVAKPVDLDALQAVLARPDRAQLSSMRRPRQ